MMTVDVNDYKKPLISKEVIKSTISDYDIYKYYLCRDIVINKVTKSPFRSDNIPSFGLFRNSTGDLIYNDFVLGGGDVFTFVKYLFKLPTWWDVYSKIGIDFYLDKSYYCKRNTFENMNVKKPYIKSVIPEIAEHNIELNVRIRPYNNVDYSFWKQFGIRKETLKRYNVFAISHIFLSSNGKEKVFSADKLAYVFVEYKDGTPSYKVYQPYSKYKWMNTNDFSVWQGWTRLPETDDTLILTKSLKDVMALYDVCRLPSASLQNEKIQPKDKIITNLKKRFINIFVLYDNDYDKKENWGRKFSSKICEEYNLIFIEIPEKYKSKDFSDLVKNKGENEAKRILNELIEQAKMSAVPF